MATNITLQDYLKNDPGVKEAKKILNEATKSLTGARNVTPEVLAELQAIKNTCQYLCLERDGVLPESASLPKCGEFLDM